MQKNAFGMPSVKLLAIALVAGVVAGAGAVYMKIASSGNGAAELAAVEADCAIGEEGLQAIRPLIKGQVAALLPADPPRRIPELTFKDGEGKDVSMADFEGKAILLNLWATWCGPCRAEMPALDALQKDQGADGKFEVVAVNIDTDDSDEKPRAFLKETGVEALELYRDNSLGVFNRLKKEGLVFGLPATMIFDTSGCLVAHMNGPAAWDSEDAIALVKAVRPQS